MTGCLALEQALNQVVIDPGTIPGATGGSASGTGTTPSAGGTVNYASTGGAAGGGIPVGNTYSAGGNSRSGADILMSGLSASDLPSSTYTNADGGVANAGNSHAATLLGTGGAGSPSSVTGNSAPGGAGGGYGAGGGGSGAVVDGTGNSGVGGAGADGFARIIWIG